MKTGEGKSGQEEKSFGGEINIEEVPILFTVFQMDGEVVS